jgi:hypothetical protein
MRSYFAVTFLLALGVVAGCQATPQQYQGICSIRAAEAGACNPQGYGIALDPLIPGG